jgi:hypothetical protein
MAQRGFEPAVVHYVLDNGTVIEDYPDDFPYPSCLILSWVSGRPVHLVAAFDNEAQEVIIITVYEPDPRIWFDGFTRRNL